MQCKKDYNIIDDDGDVSCTFFNGYWYEITKLKEHSNYYYAINDGHIIYFYSIYSNTILNCAYLEDYFYTLGELRKLKLKELNEIG